MSGTEILAAAMLGIYAVLVPMWIWEGLKR